MIEEFGALTCGGKQMTEKKNYTKQSILKIEVAGKPVTLRFTPDLNSEAAGFIKKILVSAYTLKVV